MDLATLRDTDVAALHAAADAYDGLRAALGQHLEDWRGGVDQPLAASGWAGPAADAATPSLALAAGELKAAQAEVGQLGKVLRAGADAVVLARSELHRALEDARTAGMSVTEHGAVIWEPAPYADRHDPDHRSIDERTATALAARIATALARADAVDRALAARLRHYTARALDGTGLDPDSAARDRLDPGLGVPALLRLAVPPDDAPPTEVYAWWNGLPAGEQQLLITDHPELVGNRDGIPAAARDRANRILLPRLLATYQGHPPPLSDRDRLRLEGFRRISARLAAAEGQDPPVLLLGIGEEGQGRAVLSFGDPDTARDVTSLVGGMGTELQRIGGGDADRARAVYDAARRADPTRSTASIAWLGYDAPLGLDVACRTAARAGADAYHRFLAGQRATHQGAPAHVTAQGHSYGSLVVGLAAQRPGGLPADDIVLVGSPGTGADHASDLGVGADHVYVGAAAHDPVSWAPDPAALGPAARLPPNARWYGPDPASAEFGAHRFAVADGPLGRVRDGRGDRPGEVAGGGPGARHHVAPGCARA
ncbi:alpha/beta hydrolase, partial [Kitasatospora sp. NPDC001539]|uniref:alpha/beta hydrolase n=1 Tax=Kitasatospora sp. NPDC001539 TaxID=3154384 RepID=UPI003329F4D3